MKFGKDNTSLHFIGIGGIGMSGIAEVLHNLGYKVQGSDLNENENTTRLKKQGIKVISGPHKAKNLNDASIVVISSAVGDDNPEVIEARKNFLPIVKRAEMLAELMRFSSCIAVAGTHGKTTTTSLIATILTHANLDPTVINGGIINSYGSNARWGQGKWSVVEADESDGTFIKLPTEIAVVTNIDPEHLDYYHSFEALKDAFHQYVENIPFYGFAVMYADHSEVQALITRIKDRKIITYGQSIQSDYQLKNYRLDGGKVKYDIEYTDRKTDEVTQYENIILPMPGKHNALNSLAAIIISLNIGIDIEVIKEALANFNGVKRRFTNTDCWKGINFYDDYAHHPVEIKEVLEAARHICKKNVIAIVQPHRYSRLRDLFDDFCTSFNNAQNVIITPVYEAGETPIEGYDNHSLMQGIQATGHRNVISIESENEIVDILKGITTEGDLVIFLGAGSITKWAYDIPQKLNAGT